MEVERAAAELVLLDDCDVVTVWVTVFEGAGEAASVEVIKTVAGLGEALPTPSPLADAIAMLVITAIDEGCSVDSMMTELA